MISRFAVTVEEFTALKAKVWNGNPIPLAKTALLPNFTDINQEIEQENERFERETSGK